MFHVGGGGGGGVHSDFYGIIKCKHSINYPMKISPFIRELLY